MSPDTYMLSRVDHAGMFGNEAKLRAGVIEDANKFAEAQGKIAIPLESHGTPVYPGHLATFEYQFRVVDKNDPEAKRTALSPSPNVIVKNTTEQPPAVSASQKKDSEDDLYNQLTKLDDLRKKGILTDAEFEAEKKKLLSRN